MLAALGPSTAASATLDAWIDPPVYTGEAPIYLSPSGPREIAVPQGSVLNLRVHGSDHAPSVSLRGANFEGGNGEYASSAPITADTMLRVRADGTTIGSWRVSVIADQKPSIVFAGAPSVTDRSALKLSYSAKDDYGVVSARAVIRPHGKSGAPLFLDLPLPGASEKSFSQTMFRDLTEHPYAGLDVDITLEATDAAGQTGTSNTVRFKLPARLFTDPLARALIEQRQALAAQDQGSRGRVLRTLDALTLAPDQFYAGHNGVYLSLRSTYWSLKFARHEEDITRAEDLLWQTAMSLEQGGLLTMAAQLRRMQQALTQMMAQGAPQEDIDALLKRYNDLMQRYLQSLAQNGLQNGAAPDPNAKILGEEDLAALLKAIEQLSQSGDRLKAMQLLALLQNLIENLQVADGSGSGSGTGADNQSLRDLGERHGQATHVAR